MYNVWNQWFEYYEIIYKLSSGGGGFWRGRNYLWGGTPQFYLKLRAQNNFQSPPLPLCRILGTPLPKWILNEYVLYIPFAALMMSSTWFLSRNCLFKADLYPPRYTPPPKLNRFALSKNYPYKHFHNIHEFIEYRGNTTLHSTVYDWNPREGVKKKSSKKNSSKKIFSIPWIIFFVKTIFL